MTQKTIVTRVTENEHKEIERIAKEDSRSLSSFIRKMIRNEINLNKIMKNNGGTP